MVLHGRATARPHGRERLEPRWLQGMMGNYDDGGDGGDNDGDDYENTKGGCAYAGDNDGVDDAGRKGKREDPWVAMAIVATVAVAMAMMLGSCLHR